MKQRIQGMVIGFIVATMLMGTVAFAASYQKTITVTYNDLKIIVDGKEVVPKDVNGREVQPFSFEGTNYLPLRALANAFGYPNEDIEYVQSTNTVYIGKKLSTDSEKVKLSSLDYFTSDGLEITHDDQIRANTGDYLNDCIWLKDGWDSGTRDYLINGQYSKISGTIYLDYNSRDVWDDKESSFCIWGDGKLLYESKIVKSGFMPDPFEVDISSVNTLKIGFTRRDNASGVLYFGISNTLLTKK